MTVSAMIIGKSDGFFEFVKSPIIRGNEIWRFGLVLLIVLAVMVTGRIFQFALKSYSQKLVKKKGESPLALLFKALANPAYVATFAIGIYLCKLPLFFHDENGIRIAVSDTWEITARVLGAVAAAYALYRLVDVVEHYLNLLVGKTETKLDDMLVPIVRKALRVTIAIVAILLISESILGANVKSLLLSAGVGGIAIALAAKDTIANFFGSITIFADRPFQMGEMVKIGDHVGPIEEVGFRSTRLRTIKGHLVTIPNSVIANTMVENIGQRPYIRRVSSITITYDSGHDKMAKALEIIKDILAHIPEITSDPDRPPRVYFKDFTDWALSIYMSYWVKPPDYWLYHEVNERVNLEIMKRFEVEKIDFAFPSQTLYLKKD